MNSNPFEDEDDEFEFLIRADQHAANLANGVGKEVRPRPISREVEERGVPSLRMIHLPFGVPGARHAGGISSRGGSVVRASVFSGKGI